MKRGEVYYADLSPVIGSEQGGLRPVLIIQNDVGNKYAPTTIVAPLTTATTKRVMPTHVPIRSALRAFSLCLLEQVRTIDKSRLKERMGEITAEEQERKDRALKISLGL